MNLPSLPANARRWTPDREARERAGEGAWWLFNPGELVRCPRCSAPLTEFGKGVAVAIRLHPDQRKIENRYAPPRHAQGEAFPCPARSCERHLDLLFLATPSEKAS